MVQSEGIPPFVCKMHGEKFKSKDILIKHFLSRVNNHYPAVSRILEQSPGIFSDTYMKLARRCLEHGKKRNKFRKGKNKSAKTVNGEHKGIDERSDEEEK